MPVPAPPTKNNALFLRFLREASNEQPYTGEALLRNERLVLFVQPEWFRMLDMEGPNFHFRSDSLDIQFIKVVVGVMLTVGLRPDVVGLVVRFNVTTV